MPRTSLSRATKDRGISLIELLVVVAVLSIMAALMEPTYMNAKQGLADKKFVGDLRSEIVRGHLKAIQDGQVVTISYSGTQFTLDEAALQDASQNQAPNLITAMQNQSTTQMHSLDIPKDVTFTDFRTGANDQGGAAWKLQFFPDGTSESGAVQFQLGKAVQSIQIDTHGNPTLATGPLPDTSTDIWPVGTFYERTTT